MTEPGLGCLFLPSCLSIVRGSLFFRLSHLLPLDFQGGVNRAEDKKNMVHTPH